MDERIRETEASMSKRLLAIGIVCLVAFGVASFSPRSNAPRDLNGPLSPAGINPMELTLANSHDLATAEAYDAH